MLFLGDEHKVQCSEDQMNIDVILPDRNLDASNVYLVGMKGFRIPRCQPIIKDQVAQFQLPLHNNFYECGVTRVVHKSDVNQFVSIKSNCICHFVILFHVFYIDTPPSLLRDLIAFCFCLLFFLRFFF